MNSVPSACINEIELISDKSNFTRLMSFIEQNLLPLNLDSASFNQTLTACEEVIVNIINYAYNNDKGMIKIIVKSTNRELEIEFIDEGVKYNPLEKEETDVSKPLEEREIGGLGILMVKKMMDGIKYEHDGQSNRLTIIKYLS